MSLGLQNFLDGVELLEQLRRLGSRDLVRQHLCPAVSTSCNFMQSSSSAVRPLERAAWSTGVCIWHRDARRRGIRLQRVTRPSARTRRQSRLAEQRPSSFALASARIMLPVRPRGLKLPAAHFTNRLPSRPRCISRCLQRSGGFCRPRRLRVQNAPISKSTEVYTYLNARRCPEHARMQMD